MTKPRTVILMGVSAKSTRAHFQDLLGPIVAEINATGNFPPVEVGEASVSGQAVIAQIQSLFQDKQCQVVLLGDGLVTSEHPYGLTETGRRCAESFRGRFFGAIAVTPHARRVPDIDRTVPPQCPARILGQALGSVLQRLEYLKPPENRIALDLSKLTVRPLRSGNLTEFHDYFGLRHRVYSIMGYLEDEVESCRSKLEMNEADTHAIHVGAFYKIRFNQVLIGSARIVTNTGPNEALRKLCEQMADADHVTQRRLQTADGLNLPIFQSHRGMNRIMRETYRNNQICGELSRVVVEREYRGSGISNRLVEMALDAAIRAGVGRIFLECLEIHEPLYNKHGFYKLEGIQGPVASVARTMMAMEMDAKLIQRWDGRQSRPVSSSVSSDRLPQSRIKTDQ